MCSHEMINATRGSIQKSFFCKILKRWRGEGLNFFYVFRSFLKASQYLRNFKCMREKELCQIIVKCPYYSIHISLSLCPLQRGDEEAALLRSYRCWEAWGDLGVWLVLQRGWYCRGEGFGWYCTIGRCCLSLLPSWCHPLPASPN